MSVLSVPSAPAGTAIRARSTNTSAFWSGCAWLLRLASVARNGRASVISVFRLRTSAITSKML